MLIPPRPRFHIIKWSQFIAVFMLASGIFPYVLGKGGATVPHTIYWRIAAIGVTFFLMGALPDVSNIGAAAIRALATNQDIPRETLAEDANLVRNMLWYYCLIDLALLTYLVHITGGITGSMYAGLYSLVPSFALILMFGSADVARALWLIFWAAVGIAASFCFSHFSEIEFDASHYGHAFDVGLTLVSLEGIGLLVLQVILLKLQFQRERKEEEQAAKLATEEAAGE